MSLVPYAILVCAILALGAVGSLYVYRSVDQSAQSHIIDRANTISLMVPTERLLQLSSTEVDLAHPEYAFIKTLLTRVRNANPDVRFIYLLSQRTNGSLVFYADSEPSTSEDYSPPGQIYDEAPEKMYRVFKERQSFADRYSDRWGTWVSGYAPVYDQFGRLVAMLGIDVPADAYMRSALFYASIPMIVAVLLSLLVSLALYFRRRELEYLAHQAEFLSIASHEIRSPLTGIRWALGSVLQTTPSPISNDVRIMLLKAHTNTINLIYRISNFLSVSALEGHVATVQKEPLKVHKIISDVMRDLSLTAEERKIVIHIDVSLTETLEIQGNPEYMRQIFFNIIANAVKYTRQESTITISYLRADSAHEIRVHDEGEGISSADQERIFGGYSRAHSSQVGKQVGTGLGLFLTKQALAAQGGSIRVESKEGEGGGTAFIISMPLE